MSPEQVLGGSLDRALGHLLARRRSCTSSRRAAIRFCATIRPRRWPRFCAIRRLRLARCRMTSPGFGARHPPACSRRRAPNGHQTMSELRVGRSRRCATRVGSTSSSGARGRAPAQPPERTPFVGRDAEAAELHAPARSHADGPRRPRADRRRARRRQDAAGPRADARRRETRGCLSLTGHCYEMEGAPPFVPFVEIDRAGGAARAAGRAGGDGRLAPEIATMVPSLRRVYPDIPPLPEVPPTSSGGCSSAPTSSTSGARTQKSPASCCSTISTGPTSRRCSCCCISRRTSPSMRLLVVGTYRDVELDVKRPFAKTLETLLRQRSRRASALRRLNESGVEQMLAAMSGSAPPSSLAQGRCSARPRAIRSSSRRCTSTSPKKGSSSMRAAVEDRPARRHDRRARRRAARHRAAARRLGERRARC